MCVCLCVCVCVSLSLFVSFFELWKLRMESRAKNG
jgi:hypothetical protein